MFPIEMIVRDVAFVVHHVWMVSVCAWANERTERCNCAGYNIDITIVCAQFREKKMLSKSTASTNQIRAENIRHKDDFSSRISYIFSWIILQIKIEHRSQ